MEKIELKLKNEVENRGLREVRRVMNSGGNVADIIGIIETVEGADTLALEILNERGLKGEDVSLQRFEVIEGMVARGSW